jgi:hypothetical protein
MLEKLRKIDKDFFNYFRSKYIRETKSKPTFEEKKDLEKSKLDELEKTYPGITDYVNQQLLFLSKQEEQLIEEEKQFDSSKMDLDEAEKKDKQLKLKRTNLYKKMRNNFENSTKKFIKENEKKLGKFNPLNAPESPESPLVPLTLAPLKLPETLASEPDEDLTEIEKIYPGITDYVNIKKKKLLKEQEQLKEDILQLYKKYKDVKDLTKFYKEEDKFRKKKIEIENKMRNNYDDSIAEFIDESKLSPLELSKNIYGRHIRRPISYKDVVLVEPPTSPTDLVEIRRTNKGKPIIIFLNKEDYNRALAEKLNEKNITTGYLVASPSLKKNVSIHQSIQVQENKPATQKQLSKQLKKKVRGDILIGYNEKHEELLDKLEKATPQEKPKIQKQIDDMEYEIIKANEKLESQSVATTVAPIKTRKITDEPIPTDKFERSLHKSRESRGMEEEFETESIPISILNNLLTIPNIKDRLIKKYDYIDQPPTKDNRKLNMLHPLSSANLIYEEDGLYFDKNDNIIDPDRFKLPPNYYLKRLVKINGEIKEEDRYTNKDELLEQIIPFINKEEDIAKEEGWSYDKKSEHYIPSYNPNEKIDPKKGEIRLGRFAEYGKRGKIYDQGFGLKGAIKRPFYEPERTPRPAPPLKRIKVIRGKELPLYEPKRALKVGGGIGLKPEKKYQDFGNYKIYIPSLDKNIINVRYKSFSKNENFPRMAITEKFSKFFKDVLENEQINHILYDTLSEGEKSYFNRLVREAKADLDTVEKPHHLEARLNLILGEIDAGNDGDSLKKEGRGIVKKLIDNGLISKRKGMNILLDLLD